MSTLAATPQVDEPKRTIPFPKSHIHRTTSELQLAEETLAAEARDLIMFHRLINGIHKKSLEYFQKLPSAIDREELAEKTRVALEKIIQRKNELINPASTAHAKEEHTSIVVKGTKRMSCTNYVGQYGSENQDDTFDPIEEEVFEFDF
jgi:hypothetical protein